MIKTIQLNQRGGSRLKLIYFLYVVLVCLALIYSPYWRGIKRNMMEVHQDLLDYFGSPVGMEWQFQQYRRNTKSSISDLESYKKKPVVLPDNNKTKKRKKRRVSSPESSRDDLTNKDRKNLDDLVNSL